MPRNENECAFSYTNLCQYLHPASSIHSCFNFTKHTHYISEKEMLSDKYEDGNKMVEAENLHTPFMSR
uniref:Uncharacterized protein n=1 Tax=Arion vulgaris TaxID=1028688 RepID=A0A0B7BCM7_9EUPU